MAVSHSKTENCGRSGNFITKNVKSNLKRNLENIRFVLLNDLLRGCVFFLICQNKLRNAIV